MPDVDLIVEQPTTREHASVQVKSAATQAVLDQHIEYIRRSDTHDRSFFICHTPDGALSAARESRVHVWAGDVLADVAVKSGLIDWLMERSG